MTKAEARFFVSVEGRRGEFRIDRVRIEVLCQRRFQLNRARSPGEIFLQRCVVATQASLQLRGFVLQGITTLHLAVIEMRLTHFPAGIPEESQEREKLCEPKRLARIE